MSIEAAIAGGSDRDERDLYRAGGIAAVGLGLSYLVITGLYVAGGALPAGAEGWLAHLSGRRAAWWAILGLSVLTDVLFLVVAWALDRALKPLRPNAALAGTGLLVLFALLDLVVTWPSYASLITLSDGYARAANDAQGQAGPGVIRGRRDKVTGLGRSLFALLLGLTLPHVASAEESLSRRALAHSGYADQIPGVELSYPGGSSPWGRASRALTCH